MRPRFPACAQSAALTMLATVLLALCGCKLSFEHDPAKTVTVEVTGVGDDTDREDIQETLQGMADGSSHLMTSSGSGDKLTVQLSPVEDVATFSRKINFGEVTEVDGRTVKVKFVK